MTIGVQMVVGNVHMLLYQLGDTLQASGLGDVNVLRMICFSKKKIS